MTTHAFDDAGEEPFQPPLSLTDAADAVSTKVHALRDTFAQLKREHRELTERHSEEMRERKKVA